MTYTKAHTQQKIWTDLKLEVKELQLRIKILEEELIDKKGLIESLIDKQKANGKQHNRE